MVGQAGVATAFMRLANPRLPHLVSAEAFADQNRSASQRAQSQAKKENHAQHNRQRDATPADDLEITSKISDTVQRQIASYKMSLEKLRLLRRELRTDASLEKRIWSSPDEMSKLLVERGISEQLAIAMAAEDFQDEQFGGRLAIWTWSCCCTNCCLTVII